MADQSKKLVFNVGGAIAGVMLAAVAIFGLVEQSTASQPQQYSEKINYGQNQ